MREKTANFEMTKPGRFPRPGYITFLSVFTLIQAAIDLVLWAVLKFADLPIFPTPGWFLVFLLVHAALFTVCGTFTLLGANWARILYYATCIPSYIIAAVYASALNPLTIGIYIFGFFVLLACYVGFSQPGANRFFSGRSRFFNSKRIRRDNITPRKTHGGGYDY